MGVQTRILEVPSDTLSATEWHRYAPAHASVAALRAAPNAAPAAAASAPALLLIGGSGTIGVAPPPESALAGIDGVPADSSTAAAAADTTPLAFCCSVGESVAEGSVLLCVPLLSLCATCAAHVRLEEPVPCKSTPLFQAFNLSTFVFVCGTVMLQV